MNQEFIDQMKEKLLAERSAIITSLAEHNADCKKILEENTGKDSIDEAADAIDLKLLESKIRVHYITDTESPSTFFLRVTAGFGYI